MIDRTGPTSAEAIRPDHEAHHQRSEVAARHHHLPDSTEAAAIASYYEDLLNRALASGNHRELLQFHRPEARLIYAVGGHERSRPIAEALAAVPPGASLHLVNPRGDRHQIVAAFHGHGWPEGEIVGHVAMQLQEGRVISLRLEVQ